MNVIIGSGLNALLARHILGSTYQIINAGPSRFFAVNPASADNFILANELLRPLESQLKALNIDVTRHNYKCAWSVGGDIIGTFNSEHCAFWLAKIFGVYIPTHLQLVYPGRMQFDVYGTRVNQLYAALCAKYADELQSSRSITSVQSIEPNRIVFNDDSVIEFDKCVSTIPLDDLCTLIGRPMVLNAVDVSAILVETESLDFEGYNQLFVVDPHIQFYRVSRVKENQYVFFFLDQITNPGLYLSPYMRDFDLLSGFYYPKCVPSGTLAIHDWLGDYGIIPLGMSAQWDAAMDVSSSLFRLLKIADGGIS